MGENVNDVFAFKVGKECGTTRAQSGTFQLPHSKVRVPVFMPVGTLGSVKGILPFQLESLGYEIILGNTYHLGNVPGIETVERHGGLHNFMDWNKSLLTDSGGFQMVSLAKLSSLNEEGVTFQYPTNSNVMLLTPEESIKIQNVLGSDIMMQLDDVVNPLSEEVRIEEATQRSIRWLERSVKANSHHKQQTVFPIIQGGLFLDKRKWSVEEILKRPFRGYAIGGLGGGEDKKEFIRIVDACTRMLPHDKPIYCMGIGYVIDMLICIALGVNMFDCVFPTRTARFGHALVEEGDISLKQSQYSLDFRPIDPDCSCVTCKAFTRAYLHEVVRKETVGSHYISIHNLAFIMNIMNRVRQALENNTFPDFLKQMILKKYRIVESVPDWVVFGLRLANIVWDDI